MNFLKNGLLLVFFIGSIGLTSCNKDCQAPDISENIIGTWQTALGNQATIEFQNDGTLIDTEDAIIGAEFEDKVYDQKTYVVTPTLLSVTAMPSDSSGSTSHDFNIILNKCDEIQISTLGITDTLIRL